MLAYEVEMGCPSVAIATDCTVGCIRVQLQRGIAHTSVGIRAKERR
jgi:hypothetical protein